MPDRTVVVLAVAVAMAAVTAAPVPWAAALAIAAVALVCRRPWLLVLGAALLASSLSARSLAGLRPVPPGRFDGTVRLLSDPVERLGAVRVDVRAGRRHLEAWARGDPGRDLARHAAGERVRITGTLRRPPPHATWLVPRHVAGRLSVTSLGRWYSAGPVFGAANAVRRTLVRGAGSLPADTRALFGGFVLGDDRGRSAAVTADFRGAGLSHLLVVSGQNVAFVLAAAGPVLRRCRLGPRLALTLAVIGLFAVTTRFEPSVLRASAMAAIAATATTLGRPATSLRILALAVAGLILLDPLLVRSVGFLLSAGAAAGIATLSPRIAAAIPGPRPLADALAVTLAAQAGVAPILVPVFGGIPVATLPANLMAAPAAGPVMVWGLTAGAVAGVTGGPVAAALHLPTRVLVGWVALVARWAAALPLGDAGGLEVVALALCGAVLVASTRRGGRRVVRCAAAIAVAIVMGLPGLRLAVASHPLHREVAAGVDLWWGGGGGRSAVAVAAVGARIDAADALDGLRRAGVGDVDLLVITGRGPAVDELVAALQHRGRLGLAVARSGPVPAGGAAVPPGTVIRMGDVTVAFGRDVSVRRTTGRRVASPRGAVARSPPVRHHLPGAGHGHPQPHPGLVLRPGCLLGLRRVPRSRRGDGR